MDSRFGGRVIWSKQGCGYGVKTFEITAMSFVSKRSPFKLEEGAPVSLRLISHPPTLEFPPFRVNPFPDLVWLTGRMNKVLRKSVCDF